MMYILLIISFWFGNLIRIPLGNSLQISPIDLALGVGFLSQLPYIRRHYHILREQKLFKATIYFLSMLTISLLLASPFYALKEIMIASLYIVRLLFVVSLLFGSYHLSFKKIRVLIFGFVVSGFFQLLFYPNLRNLLYLGWDDHYLRLFSSLLDPNFTGILLVAMLLTLLLRPDGDRSSWQDYILASLSFIALLLTYSRSTYIVALMVAGTIAVRKKKVSLFFALFGLIVVGIMLLPKSLPTEGADLLRTSSIIARQQEYSKALQIIMQHPLTGIGYNAYRYARASLFGADTSLFPSHAAAGVPNTYLFIAATSGLLGFLVFIYWLGTLWDEYAGKSSIAAPLLVCYICSGLFDNTMVYPFIMVWIVLILKQTEFAHQSKENHKGNERIRKAK